MTKTSAAGVLPGDSARERIRAELLVTRARSVARAGDQAAALRMLSTVPEPRPRAVLDLLARLHAQQGELKQAASYWQEVRTRHPEDPEAAVGLARIDRMRRRGVTGVLSRHRAAASVCAAAVAGVIAVPALAGNDPTPEPSARAGSTTLLSQLHDQQRQVQRAADAAAALKAEHAREQRRLEALAQSLRAPGTQAEVSGDEVEVVFARGLFLQADQLTADGARSLARLGEALADRDVRTTVHGHAAVVGGTPDRGGSVTSLWRALVAARELSESSGKPMAAFTTKSADQRDGPHRSAAANRTVTVTVTPG